MDGGQDRMAGAARQQRSSLAALWLVLAAIFAHALLPVGSPLERMAGSAFSAATSDVSLAPGRALAVEEEEAGGDLDGAMPGPGPALAAAIPGAAPVAAPVMTPSAAVSNRPLARTGSRHAPRAPPLS